MCMFCVYDVQVHVCGTSENHLAKFQLKSSF